MIPKTGETVTLARGSETRPGVVGEKQEDGSFAVFWTDDSGERLPGFWWSLYDKDGEPLNGHNWRIVETT